MLPTRKQRDSLKREDPMERTPRVTTLPRHRSRNLRELTVVTAGFGLLFAAGCPSSVQWPGNDDSGVNTHTVIDWRSSNASKFTAFYESLLALRNGSTALQQGATMFLSNSDEGQVVTYTRSDSTGTFLVAINFSGGSVSGSIGAPAESGWTDVSPSGSPGGTSHPAPPSLSLGAHDFAVFRAR